MNLVECYIIKIHDEQVYPFNKDFVDVDLTYDCYGTVKRDTKLFPKSVWEKAKERGYFLV